MGNRKEKTCSTVVGQIRGGMVLPGAYIPLIPRQRSDGCMRLRMCDLRGLVLISVRCVADGQHREGVRSGGQLHGEFVVDTLLQQCARQW